MFNWMFETTAPKSREKFNVGETAIKIHLDSFGKTVKVLYIIGRIEIGGLVLDEFYATSSIDCAKCFMERHASTGLVPIEENVFVPLDKVFKIEYETSDLWVFSDGIIAK